MKRNKLNNKVAIILGSNNDLKHAKPCVEILKKLKIKKFWTILKFKKRDFFEFFIKVSL